MNNVFYKQPKLTKKDEERLAPNLSGFNKLNELLVMDSISTDDLKRMLLIEARRKEPRRLIIKKLLGRIMTRERASVYEAIFSNARV